MMKDYWISGEGELCEADLKSMVTEYLKADTNESVPYIMMQYSDKFVCASIEKLRKLDKLNALLEDAAWLLELRVFDAERELWAHRSMLGEVFSWRIAADGVIEDNLKSCEQRAFFKDAKNYMLETCQLLDKDDKHLPEGEGEYGGKLLRSTGRGVYELPIGGEDAVQLVSYIRYDDNGMANVVDYRLKGFCKLGDTENAKGGEEQ